MNSWIYPRLYLPKKELQFGQLCSTFMHSLMQHGTKQQPIQHPKIQMMKPDNHATMEGDVLVAVSISAWQWGHIIWVDCEPRGTTVVTMAVGAPACIGVYGA